MDTTSEFDVDTLPKDLKRLRACLRCHLIKNENQFKDGCENCLVLKEMCDNFIRDCTTNNFEGMLCIMKPEDSWVARYRLVRDIRPGIYCIRVFSDLAEDLIKELDDKKIHYIRSTDI